MPPKNPICDFCGETIYGAIGIYLGDEVTATIHPGKSCIVRLNRAQRRKLNVKSKYVVSRSTKADAPTDT